MSTAMEVNTEEKPSVFSIAFRILKRILVYCICLAVITTFLQCWLVNKSYVFSKHDVSYIAEKFVGQNPKVTFPKIHYEFYTHYPGQILHESNLQWIFMNAGGWMGAVCIIHASLTEYILFFGTAVETTGHSGRYWANVSDTILIGEFHQWAEGDLQTKKFYKGATILHAWGEVTAVNFKADTWMVEYGRGMIPTTLAFALADTLFSTLDIVTMFSLLKVYTKAVLLTTWTNCLTLVGLGPTRSWWIFV